MPYNRAYSIDEVTRILEASEHRPKPGGAETGHAIRTHTLERRDMFSRPHKKKHDQKKMEEKKYVEKDSVFLVDRKYLATVVHEALNSPSGQRELEKLNIPKEKMVVIKTVILRQGKSTDFDIFTVFRWKDEPQTSFDWLSTTPGDGYIAQLYVEIHKVRESRNEGIHIQTVYPREYARTSGDNIIEMRPSKAVRIQRLGQRNG